MWVGNEVSRLITQADGKIEREVFEIIFLGIST